MEKIRVLVWNEYYHERHSDEVAAIYPQGIHQAIASFLSVDAPDLEVRTATLSDPDQGLSEEVLRSTDVLVYWAHVRHDELTDETARRVVDQVRCGMGFVPLHSSHMAKPFIQLMGTTCSLRWRESGEKERVFLVEPGHPVAKGLPPYFEIDQDEMYGERFDIPQPDELVMLSWFPTGELFRSGCAFRRGHGRIFYFQPGHETYPVYHNPMVQKVIANAVRWAAPTYRVDAIEVLHPDPLEPLK